MDERAADLLARLGSLKDELGLTVGDLMVQRRHLAIAQTELRLGAKPSLVLAELRAAGCWVIDGAEVPR